MARRCPHCNEMIDYVNYHCNTVGWETGTVSHDGDWQCDDSGTDDQSDYTYECPECRRNLPHGNDWIQGEDEDDDVDVGTDIEELALRVDNNLWTNAQ